MKFLITIIWILTAVPFSAAVCQSLDTISLQDAEASFLQQNAQLIAQRYQVEQSRADIITARLFENPELSYENLFYNHETGKYFETSRASGQYTASVTQLIKLACKRNKNIQVAETGLKMQSFAYFDLIRTLKFELRSTFYEAYYQQQSLALYDQLLSALNQLLLASEQQLKLGNTAGKDVIRIKSRLLSLQAERMALQNDLEALESRLKLLSSINAQQDLVLTAEGVNPEQFHPGKIPFTVLLDSAKVNRADLQLSKTALLYAQNLLTVQKAHAVPDVAVSLNYDLKGNYPEKYTGIGISLPIPLFNRNQGEIKKARIGVDASIAEIKRKEAEVESELYTSYQAAIKVQTLYQGLDKDFSSKFNQMLESLTTNYRERNISLLEFLDFYDSYKESTTQVNEIKYRLMNAKEELNYQTGITIFK